MRKQVVAIRLNRKTTAFQRLLSGCPQTCGMKSGYVLLGAGDSVGEHATDSKEEVIIILSGKAQVMYARGGLLTAGAKSIVYIPSQTRHDVKNIGRDVLEYVYITAPVIKK